ncbi:acyl-CoA thioesterase [Mangrovicoccus algicola]|uniref:Thioesterase family protein n=1 Tax=Mangrovicoccus algicola TaxID=2771008 RepID=A0A8J6YZX8_9RHOB|nr:thioesterase family protein [Mangrovicoccus algicola]MBE3638978.1 thioesterase family protein [Mangrovicoccus algicola]
MYPFIRMAVDLWVFRKAPPLSPLEPHSTTHHVWPWDLDIFLELNNGRTLTLYDVARVVQARRAGLWETLKREGWGMTVAGLSVRYRRRVRVFQKVESRVRLVAWDARFFYLDQSMWRKGECTSQILVRIAVTGEAGIVPTDRVLDAMAYRGRKPEAPDWVQAWIEAEAARPWPPQ